MESLPIANLDSLLSTIEPKPLTHVGIKHYRLPEVPPNTYRVFFSKGGYKDLQAENASHAYQLCERTDVLKIVNVKWAYSNILTRDVLHPTGKEIAVESQLSDAPERMTTKETIEMVDTRNHHFEMFNFEDLGRLQKRYSQDNG